jgi:hypothetical protein
LPENYDVVRVWVATRDQVRTAGMAGEIYGMDHVAVWMWMDRYGIKNQTVVFEKLNWLFYQLLETSRLNRKNSADA